MQAGGPSAVLLNIIFCYRRDKDGKKKSKKTEADADAGGDSPGSPGDEGSDEADKEEEVVWMTDTSEAAAQERAQAQLTKAMADMVTQVSLDHSIPEDLWNPTASSCNCPFDKIGFNIIYIKHVVTHAA